MEITEVKIFLRGQEDKKLRAYATITFDDAFVVRDLRIIDGRRGLFVAMPSRKFSENCPRCNHKNVVGSKFCNQCGTNLEGLMREQRPTEQKQEHRDIAHPITTESREYIQKAVLEAYERKKSDSATVEPSTIEPPTVEMPAVESPAVEPPAVEMPAVEPPAVEMPPLE